MAPRVSSALFALVALSAAPAAQLGDLQPGPNFPSTIPGLGVDHTEAIASGDIDGDGDLDLLIANGGSTGNQRNRVFVNQGGLQGGTEGDFVDESDVRLLGEPVDRSRDVDFADIDGDGDLDAVIANSSPSALFGELSRFYVNQGGLQGGTPGVFVDETLTRWGTLVSVPESQQLFGGNQGPFADWTCDCDFADLDDDGDVDLFMAGYGPNITGGEPSRLFLNDGAGVFHELWPWADDAADVSLHTLDVDAVDLDGDFDLDLVASSRDSQARVYLNNLVNPLGPRPFQDVTQTALLDTGAALWGDNNYEVEWADMDGDADFDLWLVNYHGLAETLLRNDGGDVPRFTRVDWLRGASATQEPEVDFVDFDGDGDLDAFQANFLGANPLYQSGAAQGLDPERDGLFHLTGSGAAGVLTPWPEVVEAGSGGTSWDVHVADLDGDADDDLLVGNQGEPNRVLENVLGVPDTHAPQVVRHTRVQGQVPLGAPRVVHAQLVDNGPWYDVDRSAVTLVASLSGGPPVRLPMTAQGGQLFRGVLPSAEGVVLYTIEAEDRAGNVSTTAPVGYLQGAPDGWVFTDLALPGTLGAPLLAGDGPLLPGSDNLIVVANARPGAQALLLASLTATPVPFKGGVLAAVPAVLQLPLVIDADGLVLLPFVGPPGIASAVLHLQVGVVDPLAVQGVALTNLLSLGAP